MPNKSRDFFPAEAFSREFILGGRKAKRECSMADAPDTVTEADLTEQFKTDPQFALQLLHSEFSENIYRYIKSVGYWLSEHEIDDVYQETFCRLIRAVRRPDFDRTQPSMPFVQDVAWKAAYDWGRRKKRRMMESIDAAYEQIADDLKDTTVRREWLMIKPDWPRFQKTLDKIIDALPPKQKVAARAFLVSYEQLRKSDYSALAEAIHEMTGEDVTTAVARDRWREAKATIAYKLERAGLKLLED
jgi:DNA-directed RNA polymerase specialized sigma24 family protein